MQGFGAFWPSKPLQSGGFEARPTGLEGLDDIGITLSHEADIEVFEAGRPSFKPATL